MLCFYKTPNNKEERFKGKVAKNSAKKFKGNN